MAKARKAKIEAVAPTPEQMARDTFVLERETVAGQIGAAHYRKERQLEQMVKNGLFSPSQAKALHNYRHYADMSERSALPDSLTMFMPKGGRGDGPGIAMLNAIRITADIERAAGSLAGVLRSVVVEDNPLATWAMVNYGKKLDCKASGVCYDRPTAKAMEFARLDIQFAAIRVEAELAA